MIFKRHKSQWDDIWNLDFLEKKILDFYLKKNKKRLNLVLICFNVIIQNLLLKTDLYVSGLDFIFYYYFIHRKLVAVRLYKMISLN
jgi:hypothetical protein